MILTSNEFTKKTDCKKETKTLKANLFKALGADPKHTRLPHNTIKLQGYMDSAKTWLTITSTIGSFSRCMSIYSSFSKFRLQTENLSINK